MARLGSAKRPVYVRVADDRQLAQLAELCEASDIHFIAELNPSQPANFDELESALLAEGPARRECFAGRNDPCPCGSGVKYKKCCFDVDRAGSLGG